MIALIEPPLIAVMARPESTQRDVKAVRYESAGQDRHGIVDIEANLSIPRKYRSQQTFYPFFDLLPRAGRMSFPTKPPTY